MTDWAGYWGNVIVVCCRFSASFFCILLLLSIDGWVCTVCTCLYLPHFAWHTTTYWMRSEEERLRICWICDCCFSWILAHRAWYGRGAMGGWVCACVLRVRKCTAYFPASTAGGTQCTHTMLVYLFKWILRSMRLRLRCELRNLVAHKIRYWKINAIAIRLFLLFLSAAIADLLYFNFRLT